ncbi:MAG: butyrate kinase [Erysipelotrichaceae bacterium]|nr:butyrate kinase [Erysipelotrichaceae bacterium]
MNKYKILTINPGSTSTKIALFENERCVFSKSVSHDVSELNQFETLNDQLPYRRDTILQLLNENHISLNDIDVFVGRGGGLIAMEGGTYEVDDLLLEHARTCANGVVHPANLGSQLAYEFARKYHAKAMVVNPPDVDELQDLARMTGIKDEYRIIHLHALNLKETAIQHSKNVMKKKYEDCNYIVCHIGGGISISAHRKGRMIDGNDIVGGEGPMAPTRCGSLSVANMISFMEKNNLSPKELRKYCTRNGGFIDLTGISDAIELTHRADNGDQYAKMVWNSMIYQIEKWIGSMAAVLHGDVDAILLSGGMVYSEDLVHQIVETCSFIAPVYAYPGEFEMEAMASGAMRVLNGEEELKKYTGKPVWDHFEF